MLFEGKKAVGVQYIHQGETKKVGSRREIVISASAVGSPHILLLSGIGRKEQLDKFKVNLSVIRSKKGSELSHFLIRYILLYKAMGNDLLTK